MNSLVLYVFAFVFFLVAAFSNPTQPAEPWYRRVHLGWLGLAFWVATYIKF